MKQLKILIPVMLFLTVVLYSCGVKNDKVEVPVRYVKSAVVRNFEGNAEEIYNGIVKERKEVTLSFKVGGPVDKLLVDVGDYVKEGQVIATIDKRDYKTHLQAAEAQYNQTKSEYKRYEQLYDRKKLPVNTLEKLKAAYLMSKSQYEAALHAFEDTELRAPFSGYVNKTNIERFETVAPGRPIVELLDFADLEVVINIPESQIGTVNKASKVKCDIKNANQFNLPATVKSISKKSGEDRLFEVKVVLDGVTNKDIRPGMTAKVSIDQNNIATKGVLVPIESIFENDNQKHIWVIDGSSMQVKKQTVTVNKICGNGSVLVSSGVKSGDVIVTAGVYSLLEGQKVKLIPAKSPSNNGGLL